LHHALPLHALIRQTVCIPCRVTEEGRCGIHGAYVVDAEEITQTWIMGHDVTISLFGAATGIVATLAEAIDAKVRLRALIAVITGRIVRRIGTVTTQVALVVCTEVSVVA